MAETTDIPRLWNPIGSQASVTFNKDARFLTITTKSGHLQVFVGDRVCNLRPIVFEKGGERIVDDSLDWLRGELALALSVEDGPKILSASIDGKFERIGNRLVIYCTGKKGEEYGFSILLNSVIKRKAARSMRIKLA